MRRKHVPARRVLEYALAVEDFHLAAMVLTAAGLEYLEELQAVGAGETVEERFGALCRALVGRGDAVPARSG